MATVELRLDGVKKLLANRKGNVLPPVGQPIPAAVLLPLFQKEGEYHLLFTLRTQRVEHHKGQISFPGGAYQREDDDSPLATALRETEEEVGLKPRDVQVLGELDQLLTSSNFLITPFVGIIPYPYPFAPNPVEVAELLEVPLAHLLTVGKQETGPTGRVGYFFPYQGKTIWGVTGWILKGFLELISPELTYAP